MQITPLFPRTRPAEPLRRPPDADIAVDAVRVLNAQYLEATRRGDRAWFEAHIAADAVIVRGDGCRLGKTGFVELVEREAGRYRALTAEEVTIRGFGTIVRVDAEAPWEEEGGRTGRSRYIDVWAWREGRWEVISAQVTPIPPNAAPR